MTKKNDFVKAGTPQSWVPFLLENGFELPEPIVKAYDAWVDAKKPLRKPELPAISVDSPEKDVIKYLVAKQRLELFNAARKSEQWYGDRKEKALDRFDAAVEKHKLETIRAIEDRLNFLRNHTASIEAAEVFDRAVSVVFYLANGVLSGLDTVKLWADTPKMMNQIRVANARQDKVTTADVLTNASDWFGEDTDDSLSARLTPNGRPTLVTAIAAAKPLDFSDLETRAQRVGITSANEVHDRLAGKDVDWNGFNVLPAAIEKWRSEGRTYPVKAWN